MKVLNAKMIPTCSQVHMFCSPAATAVLRVWCVAIQLKVYTLTLMRPSLLCL